MSDVDDVRSKLNIVDIIGARVQLKKAGRNFKGLCPFHNEKSPSFVVSPDRQIFHCFGCGKGGTIFDFVMEYEHVDFTEALETLAEKAGVTLERRTSDTPEAKTKQKLYELNHLASEYFHYILTKHKLGEAARIYLKQRGISDKSIETFGLGYSPNSWDALSSFLKKKGYDKALLETAGLLVSSPRGGYDRFRGRVMFTLKDHRGNVVGFAGRQLDPDAKEAKYINTNETPVYVKSKVLYGLDVTKDAIQKAGEVVIMEGEVDVISSFQAGISNVVAIKGSALTEGHVQLIKRYTDRLVFALDSDVAGDAAARRGIEIADRSGMDMKVVTLPSGKDPDEAARENPGLLKKAIKEAVPIYDYFITSAVKRYDGQSAYGKKKIADELLPSIAKIENAIVQAHYIKQLSTTLGVSEDSIMSGIRKSRFTTINREKPKESSVVQPNRSRQERLEVYLLALLLQGKTKDLFDDVKELHIEDISQPVVRAILATLDAHLMEHRVFLLKDFLDSLPAEYTPMVDEATLWDVTDTLEDDVRFSKEWANILKELRKSIIKDRLQAMTREFSNEKSHNITDERREELKANMKRLTDELVGLDK